MFESWTKNERIGGAMVLGLAGVAAYLLASKKAKAEESPPKPPALPEPSPAPSPEPPKPIVAAPDAPLGPGNIAPGIYRVATQTDPLRLRPAPSMNQGVDYVTTFAAPKGSLVVTDGHVENGFAHITSWERGPVDAWAAVSYLDIVEPLMKTGPATNA